MLGKGSYPIKIYAPLYHAELLPDRYYIFQPLVQSGWGHMTGSCQWKLSESDVCPFWAEESVDDLQTLECFGKPCVWDDNIFLRSKKANATLTNNECSCLPVTAEINYHVDIWDWRRWLSVLATVPLTLISPPYYWCHQHKIFKLKESFKPAIWLFVKPTLSWLVDKMFCWSHLDEYSNLTFPSSLLWYCASQGK